MYVMDKLGKWEDYLHLVEFSYNNNFQVLAGMSPFEIMYGRKCNTPIYWNSQVDRLMLGPDLLRDMELTMKQMQQNLKASQDRKKSYADLKRTPRELQVGEHAYIKVNPKKRYLRLGKYSKLEPRYCGTFEILDKVESVSYQLSLPTTIKVHNFFHVSILKKYVHDATHVMD